jgi:hypothetical protein
VKLHLLLLLCLGTATLLQASAAVSHEALLNALEARYQNATGPAAGTRDPSTGPVLTVQQQGLMVKLVSNAVFIPDNKVIDGRLQRLGAWSQATVSDNSGRVLSPGENVWVTRIDVKSNVVKLKIVTSDMNYVGVLSFQFAKDYLDKASPETVEGAIETYIVPQGGPPASQVAGNNPGPPQQEPPQQQPPPQGPPVTITIGQTIDQVVAALGQPMQIIDLGPKKTYKYKDLKVIFTDGKVSDVQ